MQDQVKLVEVHLILQQDERLARHLNEKLGAQILGHFWILEARRVVYSLKNSDVLTVLWQELVLVGLEEADGGILEVSLEHHVQEEAHEDGEHHPL